MRAGGGPAVGNLVELAPQHAAGDTTGLLPCAADGAHIADRALRVTRPAFGADEGEARHDVPPASVAGEPRAGRALQSLLDVLWVRDQCLPAAVLQVPDYSLDLRAHAPLAEVSPALVRPPLLQGR